MTTNVTDYQARFDEYTQGTSQRSDLTACQQLEQYRITMAALTQMRSTYWSRPCLRDWPCVATQHRSEIDKLQEQLGPLEHDLRRRCYNETVSEQAKGVARAQSTVSIDNKNIAAGRDNNYHTHLPPVDKDLI